MSISAKASEYFLDSNPRAENIFLGTSTCLFKNNLAFNVQLLKILCFLRGNHTLTVVQQSLKLSLDEKQQSKI